MTTIAINKEKTAALKEELKTLAQEIKVTKPAFKQAQREGKEPWVLESKLHSLKFQFRHKHIAYCTAKGTPYECIEQSVAEGNEPNWTFIRGIQDELAS